MKMLSIDKTVKDEFKEINMSFNGKPVVYENEPFENAKEVFPIYLKFWIDGDANSKYDTEPKCVRVFGAFFYTPKTEERNEKMIEYYWQGRYVPQGMETPQRDGFVRIRLSFFSILNSPKISTF